MDIHTAAGYMKHGYRVRRLAWLHIDYVYDFQGRLKGGYASSCTKGEFSVSLSVQDLLADDWELITDGITGHFPVTYEDK